MPLVYYRGNIHVCIRGDIYLLVRGEHPLGDTDPRSNKRNERTTPLLETLTTAYERTTTLRLPKDPVGSLRIPKECTTIVVYYYSSVLL